MRLAEYGSIPAALDAQFQRRPDAVTMVFIDGEGLAREVTCAELHSAISYVAGVLRANGVAAGDVVPLVFNHTWELAPVFLGALYLGAIPVLLPYVDTLSGVALQQQILGLLAAWQPRALITLPQYLPSLAEFRHDSACQLIAIPTPFSTTAPPPIHPGQGAGTAYLQLSSGTTSLPKAVCITHQALLNSVQAMLDAWSLTEQDVSVGWLPLHHDMGLIFEVLTPLLGGFLSVLIAPHYWVRRPRSLMQAVHRYRGTWTGMPNFAFNHCVRSIREEEMVGLDLSSWRLLLNGAELVYPESLQMFYARFAPHGLHHKALRVVYGMTENVGAISMTPALAADEPWLVDWVTPAALIEQSKAHSLPPQALGARAVVNCGRCLPGNDLLIVDEQGNGLPDRHIGEIWLRSHSLCPAYYGVENSSIPNAAGWFPTGDIGYLVAEELFICDRKKDLIVSLGKHIHPGAIEGVGVAVLGERAGSMAAFGVASVELGTELPVLVCEVRGKYGDAERDAWAAQIRQRVHAELNLALADLRFVRRGWLVQTTSAKIARSACRQKYLAEFSFPGAGGQRMTTWVARPALDTPLVAPRTPLERELVAIWADLLGVAEVGIVDSFFDLGGDSILALRMALAVEQATGERVPPEFFRMSTVAHLAEVMTHTPAPTRLAQHPVARHTAAGKVGRLARLTPQRIVRRLVYSGPVWRGHGLSYSMGIRIQRWLCRNRLIQQRVFAQEIAVFRTWLAATRQADDEAALLTRHLLANTWQHWRRAVLRTPEQWAKTVTITGAELLDRRQRQGRGVVLAVPHYADMAWLRRIVEGYEPEIHELRGVGLQATGEQRMRLHAEQLVTANVTLARGGVVLIAIDSTHGKRGIEVPFFGYKMPFRSGAAELAATTDAVIVFATWRLGVDGRMTVDFRQVPGSQEGDHERKVDDLLNQYAGLLTAAWPALLPSISFGALYSNAVSLPRLDG